MLVSFKCRFCCRRRRRRREAPSNVTEKLSMMDTGAAQTSPTGESTETTHTNAVWSKGEKKRSSLVWRSWRRQANSTIHVTAAAFCLMLTEALFRWSASAGHLGLGPEDFWARALWSPAGVQEMGRRSPARMKNGFVLSWRHVRLEVRWRRATVCKWPRQPSSPACETTQR